MTLPAFTAERLQEILIDSWYVSCPQGAQQQISRTPLLLSIDYYFASAVVAKEFNQLTASSSASRRIARPPSNLVDGQEFTISSMV